MVKVRKYKKPNNSIIVDKPNNTHIKNILEHPSLATNIFYSITILTIVLTVLAGISALTLYSYYGIDTTLLDFAVKNIFLDCFIVVVTWLLIAIIPYVLYKQSETKESYAVKGSCFIISFVTIIVFYIDYISHEILALLMCIVTFISLILLYFCTKNHISTDKSTKFKKVLNIVTFSTNFICIAIFYVSILVLDIHIIFSLDEKTKVTYTTTTYQSEQKLVLFKTEDNLVVADFVTDTNKDCTIYTKEYSIIPFSELTFTNEKFNSVTVDKTSTKPD